MRPKPTGSATQKKKLQEMLKKKKKDSLKNKVKEKLKNKKKTKSTKTGLLSKAGLMPVSTPGGIPKVMSQKTAQKDPPPSRRRPTPGNKIDRLPPELLRPKNPPKKFIPMKDGGPLAKKMKTSGRINTDDLARAQGMLGNMLKAVKKNPSLVGANKEIMNLAKKLKPTGRLNTDDIRRVREMLRKGKKPVLDSKGKPVKNLFQKADPVKKMTPEQKKQIERFKNVLKKIGSPPRRQIKKEGAIPLIGAARGAMKGMRKPAGKMMKTAARRMRKTI
jgi:hypothetical protein